jgi:DNA-directed RNA polymerase specialized sigma24 family protein
MADKINSLKLSDQELIIKIREDSRYLSVVREKYMFSCLKLLSKYSKKLKHITSEDVFSESCFQLYKNIKQKNLELTNNSSLKTYLNSICLRQLLKELNGELENKGFNSQNRKIIINEDIFSANELIELEDRLKILSSNYKTTNPDWLPDAISEDEDDFNITQKNAIKAALRKMKADGGHCAELLVLFWWRKRSMKELMEIYGYKNERTTIQQKARCQKRIKIIMQKEL